MDREIVNSRLQKLGWSQNELARRIGKERGYLSRVLSGQVKNTGAWDLIAEALRIEEQARRGTRRSPQQAAFRERITAEIAEQRALRTRE